MPYHHWGEPDFSPFVFLGPIFGLIWFGFIMYGLWRLAQFLGRPHSPAQPLTARPSALEILRERYARGEIDAETFEDMAGHLIRSEYHHLML